MSGRSKTQELIATSIGQHVALSIAAHLARTELIPDSRAPYAAAHLLESLNRVGSALARVAPLYVRESRDAEPRELAASELEDAAARDGAAILVLKDGRKLSAVTMKRADLGRAIAILKRMNADDLGVRRAVLPPPASPATPDGRLALAAARLAELEKLLHPPYAPPQLRAANQLVLSIARYAPCGTVANRAMQLMSALQNPGSETDVPGGCQVALARLRLALEEARNATASG
jgi:hypothetical protein